VKTKPVSVDKHMKI